MKKYIYSLIAGKDNPGFKRFLNTAILFPLSLMYAALVRLRNLFFDLGILKATAINSAVISVGNITWGGTGKTALVDMLLDFFKHKDVKVCVLIRGYKRKRKQDFFDDDPDIDRMGDEAYLLKSRHPEACVLVSKKRVRAALFAQNSLKARAVILDDGFGQRVLSKGLDILLIDCLNPFGNRRCIPAGILREPLSSLKRADIFIITNCINDRSCLGIIDSLKAVNCKAKIFKAAYYPDGIFELFKDQRVSLSPECEYAAMAGIGNFDSFKQTVAGYLLKKPRAEFALDDHYEYSEKNLKAMTDKCKNQGIGCIVTSEKDAVKIRHIKPLGITVFVLKASLRIIDSNDDFVRMIEKCI